MAHMHRQSYSGPLQVGATVSTLNDLQHEDLVQRAYRVTEASLRLTSERRRSHDLSNAANLVIQKSGTSTPPTAEKLDNKFLLPSKTCTTTRQNNEVFNFPRNPLLRSFPEYSTQKHNTDSDEALCLNNMNHLQVEGGSFVDEIRMERKRKGEMPAPALQNKASLRITSSVIKPRNRARNCGATRAADFSNTNPEENDERTMQFQTAAPVWLKNSNIPEEKTLEPQVDISDDLDELQTFRKSDLSNLSQMSAPSLRLYIVSLKSKVSKLLDSRTQRNDRETKNKCNLNSNLQNHASEDIDSLRNKLYDKSMENQQLKDKLQKLQIEYESTLSKLPSESRSTTPDPSETSSGSSSPETANVFEINAALRADCSKLEEDCAALCRKLAERTSEVAEIELKLERKEKEAEQLVVKVKQQREACSKAEKTLNKYKEMQAEVAQVKSTYRRKSKEVDTRKTLIRKLKMCLETSEEKRKSAEKNNAEITLELEKLKARESKDAAQRDDEKRLYERTCERLKVTESDVVELRAQLESSATLHSVREGALEEQKSKCVTLEQSLQTVSAEMNDYKERLNVSQKKVEEVVNILNGNKSQADNWERWAKQFLVLVRSVYEKCGFTWNEPEALLESFQSFELTEWSGKQLLCCARKLISKLNEAETSKSDLEQTLEARVKQVEQSALENLVRLCVAAPTVNVHVGADKHRVTVRPHIQDEKIREVIQNQVLPRYTKFYVQHADGKPLDGKQMNSWMQTLVSELQQSIQTNLACLMKSERRYSK